MEEQLRKEYLRRLRLVLRSKLTGWNELQAVNTWMIASLRCGDGIIYWKKKELTSSMTRKILTGHGAFHSKNGTGRLYSSRRKSGRNLISC